MNHQTFFTRNLLDSSYILLFKDSYPHFFLHSYLNKYSYCHFMRQKYYPDMTKTDIARIKFTYKR